MAEGFLYCVVCMKHYRRGETHEHDQSTPPPTSEDRVALAGAFWEMGEPLTDEVNNTRAYLRQKFGRDDIPPPKVGWKHGQGGVSDNRYSGMSEADFNRVIGPGMAPPPTKARGHMCPKCGHTWPDSIEASLVSKSPPPTSEGPFHVGDPLGDELFQVLRRGKHPRFAVHNEQDAHKLVRLLNALEAETAALRELLSRRDNSVEWDQEVQEVLK